MVRLRVQGAARGALTAGERGRLRRRAERMLRAAALTAGIEGAEVGLTLVGDTEIHELNRDYRRKDKPPTPSRIANASTSVGLSFLR